MDMATIIKEQARLIFLKALAAEADEALNSDLLAENLKTAAIPKERAWVHQELRWLEEMGAVTLREFGTLLVATLTEHGARHVRREITIEGVRRPSRPGA